MEGVYVKKDVCQKRYIKLIKPDRKSHWLHKPRLSNKTSIIYIVLPFFLLFFLFNKEYYVIQQS